MKKVIALILFAMFTSFLFAEKNSQDVIYLKNGSIIRGSITEQIPNKTIKIQTSDRNIFVFQMDEIEKITKETIQSKDESTFNDMSLPIGFKRIVELGYQFGVGEFGYDRLKIGLILSYQVHPYISIGIGTGLRSYFEFEEALIPFFADFRANLMDSKFSPYVSLGIGYNFQLANSLKGEGVLINPTAGVCMKLSPNSIFNVGLGYEMQRMTFIEYPIGRYFNANSGAISLVIGISF